MRLEFSLLVVDDAPSSVDEAIGVLSDYLESKGFSLRTDVAKELTEKALRDLARRAGKNYNLVMVDFNLGSGDLNGAIAASKLRREMQYTDMVFYSSSPSVDLLAELAKHDVAGVFVADRGGLGDTLKGIADTVIGKAVDLSHMRGVAMAEVSEMDVQMEEVLERLFGLGHDSLSKISKRTLDKLLEGVDEHRASLAALIAEGKVVEIVVNPRLFPSMHKYKAMMRAAELLPARPTEQLAVLSNYDRDVIGNRNTLAHAKEEILDDGSSTLRAIVRGKPSVPIDDAWMTDFRGKLRSQRAALSTLCAALDNHIDTLGGSQKSDKA